MDELTTNDKKDPTLAKVKKEEVIVNPKVKTEEVVKKVEKSPSQPKAKETNKSKSNETNQNKMTKSPKKTTTAHKKDTQQKTISFGASSKLSKSKTKNRIVDDNDDDDDDNDDGEEIAFITEKTEKPKDNSKDTDNYKTPSM
jgi:hypothetical protein